VGVKIRVLYIAEVCKTLPSHPIRISSAEIWTPSSTAIGRIYSFIKAKITGDENDLGAHKHVELKH